MAVADFLNADMATVGAHLRAGAAWWVDELAAMIPRALRSGDARARTVALLSGPEPIFLRDGRRLASPPAGGKVVIALPRVAALVREVVLPRLPRADTRRLLALDLDRLTPLDPASAVFDFQTATGDAPTGRQSVRLAVVTRTTANAALARAADLGLSPLALAIDEGAGAVCFDFLPALADAGARRPPWTDPRNWWLAAALLLLANIGFAVWRDAADIARLTQTVDTQSDAVQLAQRARARVRAEDARRAALVTRRAVHDPLVPLAVATTALPRPAWVQRLTWDGHALRLTGFTTEAIDPIAALRRSGAFASVRPSTSDLAPALARYQPFDLTAERAAPAALKVQPR